MCSKQVESVFQGICPEKRCGIRRRTSEEEESQKTKPLQGVPGRLARLRSEFPDLGIDALLITHGPNRRYMTGFTGSAGIALVTQEEAF